MAKNIFHISFLIVCLLTSFSYGQEIAFSPYDFQAEGIYANDLGFIYAVNGCQLTQLDLDGKKLANFSNCSYGDITSVDVSNPHKILLFFKETGTILLLNDQLAEILPPIDLFSLGLTNVSMVAFSPANEIWLYDERNDEMIRIDAQQFTSRHSIPYFFTHSAPLRQLLVNEKTVVAVLSNDGGVQILDHNGRLIRSLPLQPESPIQLFQKQITYSKENQLVIFDFDTYETNKITLADSIKQALIVGKKIIILKEDGTCWYTDSRSFN
ncbi:MAG: hypothetical protein MJZ76_10895 [Bacteroidales bacterium]|nr:hypothetical protein [Bacteroidales bacterium]